MTNEERERHEAFYESYFGYPHLTVNNRSKRGALTSDSKY